METIFNTFVEVTSQEQANRLKQVCIDNGLPIWDSGVAFNVNGMYKWFFCNLNNEFFIRNLAFVEQEHKITESEWMKLLEQQNKTKSKLDILIELIDYATTNDNLWLKNQLEKLR